MIAFATLALAASVAWVFCTTVGYSRYLARRARASHQGTSHVTSFSRSADVSPLPSVSAIVATRESAAVIEARVRDLRCSAYPAPRLSIVIGLDASVADERLGELRTFVASDPDCRVVAGTSPGKASALNAAVAAATGEVLLFADSHQSFPPPLIGQLVSALRLPGVGAATGLVATPRDDEFSATYWKNEQQVRAWQSAYHSVICVTGAVYAMPRSLFTPIPAGTICDDLFATMTLASAGHRVVLVPDAIALDTRRFTGAEQNRRRIRTMTGLVQLLRSQTHWLRPARNPMWLDLWVHKVNRLALPWVMLIGLMSGGYMVARGVQILSPAQRSLVLISVAAAVVAFGVTLLLSHGLRDRVFGVLRAIMVPVIALGNGIRGRWNVWTPVPERATEPIHQEALPDSTLPLSHPMPR